MALFLFLFFGRPSAGLVKKLFPNNFTVFYFIDRQFFHWYPANALHCNV